MDWQTEGFRFAMRAISRMSEDDKELTGLDSVTSDDAVKMVWRGKRRTVTMVTESAKAVFDGFVNEKLESVKAEKDGEIILDKIYEVEQEVD